MSFKSILWWMTIAAIVWWVIENPHDADHILLSILSWGPSAAHGLSNFFASV